MIIKCKKCGGENLYLEPRVKGQDVMTANMVALKCKDCGSSLFRMKDLAQDYINRFLRLRNCKPVKVEIRVVGE